MEWKFEKQVLYTIPGQIRGGSSRLQRAGEGEARCYSGLSAPVSAAAPQHFVQTVGAVHTSRGLQLLS